MEQKQLRLEVSQDMLDYTNSDPEFLNIMISGDESWVYGYDPETKAQSSQWKRINIPEAKKSQAGAEQRQSDVDRFLSLPWSGASRVRTTRPKH
jgi:hypothetical protein